MDATPTLAVFRAGLWDWTVKPLGLAIGVSALVRILRDSELMFALVSVVAALITAWALRKRAWPVRPSYLRSAGAIVMCAVALRESLPLPYPYTVATLAMSLPPVPGAGTATAVVAATAVMVAAVCSAPLLIIVSLWCGWPSVLALSVLFILIRARTVHARVPALFPTVGLLGLIVVGSIAQVQQHSLLLAVTVLTFFLWLVYLAADPFLRRFVR
jgi:hypothetical protein